MNNELETCWAICSVGKKTCELYWMVLIWYSENCIKSSLMCVPSTPDFPVLTIKFDLHKKLSSL